MPKNLWDLIRANPHLEFRFQADQENRALKLVIIKRGFRHGQDYMVQKFVGFREIDAVDWDMVLMALDSMLRQFEFAAAQGIDHG